METRPPDPTPPYRHARIRTALFLMVGPALFASTLALLTGDEKTLWLILCLALAFALLLLHSVQVVVDDEGLEVSTGNGWIRRRLPADRIVGARRLDAAAAAGSPLWNWPRGGGAVVAIELRDARPLRLVTDEPEDLLLALRRHQRGREADA